MSYVTVYVTTREVTVDECPWLTTDLNAGLVLYACVKHTYGCVSPTGTPVTLNKDGDYPFFEVPADAIVPLIHMDETDRVTRGFGQ